MYKTIHEDLKGKKLLVLGGTRISCEIIEKAKELGVVVAVADYNSVDNSPGKQIADEDYLVSVLDVDAVADVIRKNSVDGVLTGFSDQLLPYYAEICRKTGLPAYADKEQLELYTHKSLYKPLLRKYGIPTVEEYTVDQETFNDDVEKLIFPVLVKPSDGSGARGISVCKEKDELVPAIKKAVDASKDGKYLIERYLDDDEVTVFWVFIDGEYYLEFIGNRHVKYNQGNDIIPLPVGYSFPAAVTTGFRKNIEENAKKMFKDTGLRNGMMFMQCKVHDGECIVYDIGYRLTGSLEYRILENLYGYDPMEMMIRFALTGKMTAEDISGLIDPEKKVYSYNVSCLASPGKIGEICVRERLRSQPDIFGIFQSYVPGDEITDSMKGQLAQIAVRVLGGCANKKEVYEKMSEAEDSIEIISEDGRVLGLAGIEEKDLDGCLL